MTLLGFQRVNLPNARLFRFLRFLSYRQKFLCLSKALEASKDGPPVRIPAEQKISKSIFAQNITSNVIIRLPEGQPTQCATFSIFDILVLKIPSQTGFWYSEGLPGRIL